MSSKVNVTDLVVSVLGAAVVGVGIGVAIGFSARAMGWPTSFVGPLTGGLVSGLVAVFYQLRTKRRTRGAA